MDLRRPPRSSSGGVEPRFRQVGFVTNSEPPAAPAPPTPAPAASSPPASGLSRGSLSPVMIPPPRIPDHLPPPHASGVDSLLPSSPPPASSSLLDAASDPDDDVDVSWARPPPPAPLEAVKGDLTETQNEGAPARIPQKAKLYKAQRHAIQESQRAAKAAAKEAGISGQSTTTDSGVSPAASKQPKTVKTSLKKDVPQVTPPVASDKTGERSPDRDRKKDGPHPRMQFDDVHQVEKAKRHSVVNQSEA